MKIQDVTDYLESFFSLIYQESYDNSGLIIGDKDEPIRYYAKKPSSA